MLFDIEGKINQIKLAPSKALLPMFEAVINSIQATKDSGIKKGLIQIYIHRDESQMLIEGEEKDLRPIKSISITDNGIGFNDENYKSFQTANSTQKLKIGGKGVGRFIWLKAFDNVKVESIFKNHEERLKREFKFEISPEGITSHKIAPVNGQSKKTTIYLNKFKLTYRNSCPRDIEIIAEKTMRHCMGYFVLDDCPTIIVCDKNNNEEIVLNDLYKKSIKKVGSVELNVKKFQFNLDVYKILNIKTRHLLHYCAHNREVYGKSLANDIPELNRRISAENEEEFYIHAFVRGDYLDEMVNSERTGFNFPATEDDTIDFPDVLSEDELKNVIINGVEKSISNFLKVVRDEKLDRIRKYVERKAPQYRPLFKYKKKDLERLPLLSEAKLEIELFKILHSLEVEVKKEGRAILKKIKDTEDFEKYEETYNEYIDKVIHIGNTNLSKYIVHRKLVLSILEKNLRKNEFGKFAKEAAIHRLIFPLNSTSDDISYEDHNLWIIDERLAYHTYIASDKAFKKIDPIDIESSDRPDLIVFKEYFDNQFAFSNKEVSPFQSIVVVEFKRPMRGDYREEDDNPISQTLNYIDLIRSGKGKLKNGRKFNTQNVPIYCYIISDLTEKLEKIAKQYNYTITHDGEGYFGFNSQYNAYIEIISYDKLLTDAKQRNQILFDKLKLPVSD